jgi:hypothetical protein
VGFVAEKIPLGQIFFEYFDFSCQFLFHQMLHTYLSCGVGIISHLVSAVPSGLIPTQLHEIKKLICVELAGCCSRQMELKATRMYEVESDHRRGWRRVNPIYSYACFLFFSFCGLFIDAFSVSGLVSRRMLGR